MHLGRKPAPEPAVTVASTTGWTAAAQDDTRAGADAPTGAPQLPTDSRGAAAGPLHIGAAFGTRYRIRRLLGIGGMGAVYEAWDAELGVAVALKVIRAERADPAAARDLERRFKRELLLARQVTHKHVVRIHDLGEIDGIKYITMPYVEGRDLATVLAREGRLSVARTLGLARQALSGLAAAHAEGIVHRDLKPANIMVDNQGQALLMDFGIARSIGLPSDVPARIGQTAAGVHDQTVVGAILGTIRYMAPEQARGLEADHRSDVYAFGLIMRDMLCGLDRSRSSADAFVELEQRTQAPPPPIRTIDPAVPEPIDAIVSRCLAVDPDARYQTAADLLADIERLDEDGRVRPVPSRLRPWLISLAAAILVAAGTWRVARTPAPVSHEPVSLLIADFDNQTGDAAFEGPVEQALGIALEGAPFVTAYSRDSARRLAARIQPGSRLDESAARLVSRREGIKIIVVGSMARDGAGYRVSARALDPAGDPAKSAPLAASSERAKNREQVLEAANRVAASLRRSLGDSTTESARLAAGETFTASSLEAVRLYSQAQDLASRGRDEDALDFYRRAIEIDPNFGRAYSGWATSAFHLGRKDEAAAHWKKALALMDRMSDREKYRTLGTYNLAIAGNYEQAIDNYSALVRQYPTDLVGHNNLAYAYFSLLNFSKAAEEGRRALALYPNNVVIGNNSALYAMYAGEFDAAAAQARQLVKADPDFVKNYLPLAVAAALRPDETEARSAYRTMAGTGALGASLSSMGLADLAMYHGRWTEAEGLLEAGIASDEDARAADPAAMKMVALSAVYEAQNKSALAVQHARRAIAVSRQPAILVPAAKAFVRAGLSSEAAAISRELDDTLQTQNRAYARIIDGNIAVADRRFAAAVDAFRAAIKLGDVWMARFDLGVAYVEAGHYAEGLAELDACIRRRGEAAAIFLDDVPSVRMLAPLAYWVGRAQEGTGQQAAAVASYKSFLAIRNDAADPLVEDAKRRVTPDREARERS
jgi:eukaryotic-like serine/threonine-protein kinase